MRKYADRIFFGPVPTIPELEGMKAQGISLIWNLAREYSHILDVERKYVHEVLWADIEDFGVPDMKTFVEQLDQVDLALTNKQCVFLHCQKGVGRSSIALAALDMMVGFSLEYALQYAREATGGPETEVQVEFLRALEKELRQ
jgi:protein-tyrosine phosphatase